MKQFIYKSPVKRFESWELAITNLADNFIIRFQPNNDASGGWGYFVREPIETANKLDLEHFKNKAYKH